MKRVEKLLLALTPALLGLVACADPSASSSSPSSSLEGSSGSSSSLVESSSSESPIPEVSIAIIAPEKTTLEVGESITLQTKVENMPEGGAIGFSSSDPSVASVAQDGTLTALKAGTTEITASIGEVESEPLTITVENPELIVEILAPAKTELKIGETLKLEAKVENNIDGLPLVYSSSDEGVISVDQEGNVTALSSGNATITLTVGEASDSVELSVSLPDAESIEIHLDATAMYVGQTLTVEATILPSTASQEYTVSVSNEIYLGVDGHEITAKRTSEDPIVVTVSTERNDPIYQKRVGYSKKYYAHDENNAAVLGDTVTIMACRPISKLKRYRLVSIDKHASLAQTVAETEAHLEESEGSSEEISKEEANAQEAE